MADTIRNIFVSHVHEDDDRIGEMKSLLEKKGFVMRDYSITKDKPNQAESEDYIKSQVLAPQINACSAMVVIVTPISAQSEWVNWEIDYARKQGMPVIGVYAHGENGCTLPQALDDVGNQVVGWNADTIIDAIESGGSGSWEMPDGSPAPARGLSRYKC